MKQNNLNKIDATVLQEAAAQNTVRTGLEDALEAAHDDIHDAKTRIGHPQPSPPIVSHRM